MPAVGLLSDVRFQQHETTPNHPESPQRLVAIERLLDEAGLRPRFRAIEPQPVSEEALRRVHSPAHLDLLAAADREAQEGRAFIDADTVMSPASLVVAREAAGGVLRAADLVARGELDGALCLVRPPGHHATASRAMGFCLINNVAVAAAHLLAAGPAERVAIVDFDVHHGNGTQEIFYREARLLYLSTHQSPHYPGTGASAETGAGEAEGATINLPLPAGCGDAQHLACFDRIILPALRRFGPSLIIVSAGFDGHWRDPLAGQQISGAGYRAIAERLHGLCNETGARPIYVLEGGYDLEALAWSVRHCADVLLGNPPAADPVGPPPAATGSGAPDIEPILAEAARIHGL